MKKILTVSVTMGILLLQLPGCVTSEEVVQERTTGLELVVQDVDGKAMTLTCPNCKKAALYNEAEIVKSRLNCKRCEQEFIVRLK